MKKCLSAILCAALLLSVCVSSVRGAVGEQTPSIFDPMKVVPVGDDLLRCGDWEFRVLEDGTAELTGFWSMDGIREIPAEVAGHRVGAIGDDCFCNRGAMRFYTDDYPDFFREMIRSIVIPEGVTSIGDHAFEGCGCLTEVVLPDSLVRIGAGAFEGCALLMKADLPPNLAVIGDRAFKDCKVLACVDLPASVQTLGINPFAGCTHLNRITVSPAQNRFTVAEGLLIDAEENRVICCTRDAWAAEPAWPEGIRSVGAYAFTGAGFERITLPDTLVEIGDCAFSDCTRLKSLVIPAGVQLIGDNPVRGCTALESLILDEAQDRFSLRDDALYDNADARLIAYLKQAVPIAPDDDYVDGWSSSYRRAGDDLPAEIERDGIRMRLIDTALERNLHPDYETVPRFDVPEGIVRIGGYAFYGSVIEVIRMPDSVGTIGEGAFMNCEYLRECALPEGIDRIPDHAFHGCTALADFSFSDSLVSVGSFAFYEAGIPRIALPDSVTELGRYAFCRCEAASAALGSGLTRIPRGAFCESKIEEVTIPETVSAIGVESFAFCTRLDQVILPEAVTVLPPFCFFSCCLRSVPIPSGVICIGDYAFSSDNYYSSALENVVLPEGLPFIGNNAFKDALEDESIRIPGSVRMMGRDIFRDCHLKNVQLAEGLPMIGEGMFAWCGLESITIPDSVSFIGDLAFAAFTSKDPGPTPVFRLPDHDIEFGGNPFVIRSGYEKDAIRANPEVRISPDHPTLRLDGSLLIDESRKRVIAFLPAEDENRCTVPDGIEVIGASAFANTDLAGGITLPDSLRVIEDSAFEGSNLAEIRFPEGRESIGDSAFYGSSLTAISLPDGLREIGDSAFACLSDADSTGYRNGRIAELIIPGSVRRIGKDLGISITRIVFEPGEVTLESPLGMHDGLEIIVPEDHPTLEMADGNLYSRQDARLIAQMGDMLIREGTRIIDSDALKYRSVPIVPASVEQIRYYVGEWWYDCLPEAVYAVPGSRADAYFDDGWMAQWP